VIAKSNGTTLKEHTKDSLGVIDYLISANKDLLDNWAKLNNINIDSIFKGIQSAMTFHDFGKGTLKWQKEALNEDPHLPPHAPYSGYFLLQNEKDICSLLACISHHSLLTESSFDRVPYPDRFDEEYLNQLANEFNYNISFDKSWKNYFENLKNYKINSQYPKFRNKWNNQIDTKFKSRYCLMLSYLTASDGIASKIEEENLLDNVDKNLKKWFPSSQDVYHRISEIEGNKKLTEIQRKVLSELSKSSNIYELSQPLRVEAPCGEGKTLAALLAGKELLKENIINKVIFTLPTQVTSNNMVQEFEDEYGIPKDWIGIYHSEVMSFLVETNDEEQESDFSLSSQKFWNLIYSKPFNISTIDHLLLSLVNGFKFAPRAFGNILNSLIVIDELHYYDSHTVGMIECLCEVLRHLKIPHIIMSATIPNQIKEKFDAEYKKIQSSGNDNEGNEKNPFIFEYHDTPIDHNETLPKDFLDILDDTDDLNIGIIVNTVPKSKKIFTELKQRFPQRQILLYNSQFMRKDRPKKEKILRILGKNVFEDLEKEEIEFCNKYGFNPDDSFIFVGTQVAEISLNVSFDLILSDLAPLDALIQRGGRLHRKMSFNNTKNCQCPQCERLDEEHTYKFHIFDTGEFCFPYYTDDNDELMKEVIDNTRMQLLENSNFNFKTGIKMMDQVYKNEEMFADFNPNTSFWKAYIEDLIFGKKPVRNEEEGGQMRIQTRNINHITYDVLPQQFEYEDYFIQAEDFIKKIYGNYRFLRKDGNLNFEGINKISKYMVKVSNKLYFSHKSKSINLKDEMIIKIIDAEYTFKTGLNFFDDHEIFI
jgi:CRISPR-associated endonuclease/helicase Cas3